MWEVGLGGGGRRVGRWTAMGEKGRGEEGDSVGSEVLWGSGNVEAEWPVINVWEARRR